MTIDTSSNSVTLSWRSQNSRNFDSAMIDVEKKHAFICVLRFRILTRYEELIFEKFYSTFYMTFLTINLIYRHDTVFLTEFLIRAI